MYKYLISIAILVFVSAFYFGRSGGDDAEGWVKGVGFQACVMNASQPEQECLTRCEEIQYARKKRRRPADVGIPRLLKAIEGQVLYRDAYTVSYNVVTKNPNWVAWHLTREHASGSVPRYKKGYLDDNDVVGYMPKETDWDDMPLFLSHGHMCPAGDNKWDEHAMKQTFLLSNMCPQADKLNSGGWNSLEMKCREWAKQYGSVYVVCGPIFYSDAPQKMGQAQIWIPDAFYKVVLCAEGAPKAIGFVYENNELPQKMRACVRSVDEIEEMTGIDFFYHLPDAIENAVESVSDIRKWE